MTSSSVPESTAAPAASAATAGSAAPSPRLGSGPLGIAIRVVVTVVFLLLSSLAPAPFAALITAIPGIAELGDEMSWASLGIYVLMSLPSSLIAILLAWGWVRFVERRRLRDIGLRITRSSALWLLLAAAVAILIFVAVTAVMPSTGPAPTLAQLTAQGPLYLSLIAALVPAFIAQGFPEELLFRGMLMSSMRVRPIQAIAVSVLSFTAIHLVSNGWQQTVGDRFLYLVMPFGFALLAVGMLLWTRSLWAAVGVHGGMHMGETFAQLIHQTDPRLSFTVIGVCYAVLGIALTALALRRGRAIPLSTGEWR